MKCDAVVEEECDDADQLCFPELVSLNLPFLGPSPRLSDIP